jgi:glyoxylase-like metal-dependent hydrolase (beta-lactamase superfamily II)
MSLTARITSAWLCAALAALLLAAPAPAQDQFAKAQIKTTEVGNGVYMLEGLGGNMGLSVGSDGAILIDDQFGALTDKIVFAIRQLTDLPIRYVINTHWHQDHTDGNQNFAERGTWIVAHDNVRNRMSTEQFNRLWKRAQPASPAAALPVVTFSDNLTFHVNDQDIHAFHVENAHPDGDAIVHFQNRNVIHMGDCFFNGDYPLIDTGAGGTIRGMIRAANAGLLLADGTTKIIPGHGPVATREDLRAFRDMLLQVEGRIQALVSEGKTLEEIARLKPLADLDPKWGGGFMKPDMFLQVVVDDLSR